MKYDLDPAREIIKAFLAERDKIKIMRQGISSSFPPPAFWNEDQASIFDPSEFTPAPDSFWEKDDAYGLLLADPHFWRQIVDYNHKAPRPPMPEYYIQLALPIYQQWKSEKKEVFYRKCVKIPEPTKEETLIDYLQRLQHAVSDGNERRDVWIESFRSFLQFLRDDTQLDQKGPLEMLFPSKEGCKGMEIRDDFTHTWENGTVTKVKRRIILRRTENTIYPVDILVAAEIIQNLIHIALKGRPNSQRSAIEALAFAWLCLAVGFRRMSTREELVFSVTLDQLAHSNQKNLDKYSTPSHFVKVPSLFGFVETSISKILHDLLRALPRDASSQRVFSMDLDTILRTFRRAVKQSKRSRNLGPVTFFTFMSQPHEAFGHRALLTSKKLSPTKQSK